jgi:hypothetical protein
MKVTINVECTPEEARAFFGAPDVTPLQKAMMDQMQSQMHKTAAALDPDTMLKTLFPVNSEGFVELQKAFWGQFMGNPDSKHAK